jgi:hypothetical protein
MASYVIDGSTILMIPSTAKMTVFYDIQGKMYIYVASVQFQVVAVAPISHLPLLPHRSPLGWLTTMILL